MLRNELCGVQGTMVSFRSARHCRSISLDCFFVVAVSWIDTLDMYGFSAPLRETDIPATKEAAAVPICAYLRLRLRVGFSMVQNGIISNGMVMGRGCVSMERDGDGDGAGAVGAGRVGGRSGHKCFPGRLQAASFSPSCSTLQLPPSPALPPPLYQQG